MFPIIYQASESKENVSSDFEIIIRGDFWDARIDDRSYYEFSYDDFFTFSSEESYNTMELLMISSLKTKVLFIKGDFTLLWDTLQILLLSYQKHNLLSKIESLHIVNDIEGEDYTSELEVRMKKKHINAMVFSI